MTTPEEKTEVPMTISIAIGKARTLGSQPEYLLDNNGTKQVIGALLAAIEFHPSFLKAVELGEPVFVLRAQDLIAPSLVRQWADRASDAGCPQDKVQEARTKAARMEAWTPRKYPD